MNSLRYAAALVVGATFAAAAVGKFARMRETAEWLTSIRVPYGTVAVQMLVVLEMGVALGQITAAYRGAATLGLGILIVGSVWIVVGRKNSRDCACFGTRSKGIATPLWRNAAVASALLVLLFMPGVAGEQGVWALVGTLIGAGVIAAREIRGVGAVE